MASISARQPEPPKKGLLAQWWVTPVAVVISLGMVGAAFWQRSQDQRRKLDEQQLQVLSDVLDRGVWTPRPGGDLLIATVRPDTWQSYTDDGLRREMDEMAQRMRRWGVLDAYLYDPDGRLLATVGASGATLVEAPAPAP